MGFRRVLIANRGEIALRILRTLRTRGSEVCIVHAAEDRLSRAVHLSDRAVEIHGPTPVAAYLDIEQIVQVAVDLDVDAVHPGYGFLSENPTFAERLNEEGISFIGPSPEVLRVLGDKIEARRLMGEAGLPTASGSSEPIDDEDAAFELANSIGFPVIVKAAAGGGGIGMQVVHNPDEFKDAVRSCTSRAASAFGDGRVFVEKFIERGQHIEFQVLCDGTNAIHFGERFCSIQRRHQKVLEEGPWLDEEERSRIGDSVCRGAESVGYSGLATFEFLRGADGSFAFLEVNPRVQVEHTVTEMITGVDLVELGIQVAEGSSLPMSQEDVNITGHAIQLRINAEDPNTFHPSPGKVWDWTMPSGPGVRVDTHAHPGYEMPEAFDSLLGKLIIHGSDRDHAIRRTLSALDEIEISGVRTLLSLHRRILAEPDFLAGDVTIHYLEEHPDLLQP